MSKPRYVTKPVLSSDARERGLKNSQDAQRAARQHKAEAPAIDWDEVRERFLKDMRRRWREELKYARQKGKHE